MVNVDINIRHEKDNRVYNNSVYCCVLIRAFEVALLVVAEIVLWVLIDRPKHLQFNSVLFYAMNTTHSQTSMF